VARTIRQVRRLEQSGIKAGVNLLVAADIEAAADAAKGLRAAGIENDRVVYLPMKGLDSPNVKAIARVAGSQNFQSMSCLLGCQRSPIFCSVGWDKSVSWCSYTPARTRLPSLTMDGLLATLARVGLTSCEGALPRPVLIQPDTSACEGASA
jgi:hypothetical protein